MSFIHLPWMANLAALGGNQLKTKRTHSRWQINLNLGTKPSFHLREGYREMVASTPVPHNSAVKWITFSGLAQWLCISRTRDLVQSHQRPGTKPFGWMYAKWTTLKNRHWQFLYFLVLVVNLIMSWASYWKGFARCNDRVRDVPKHNGLDGRNNCKKSFNSQMNSHIGHSRWDAWNSEMEEFNYVCN